MKGAIIPSDALLGGLNENRLKGALIPSNALSPVFFFLIDDHGGKFVIAREALQSIWTSK